MPVVRTERPYGGVSAGERQARRRTQLIDAGLELFGSRGYPQTTIRDVCAEAGLTERYFYESFDGREALLVAVFEEVASTAKEQVTAAVDAAGRDPAAGAHAAIDTFVAYLSDDPRRARVMFLESVGTSDALELRRLATISEFARMIRERIEALAGDAAPPQQDLELTTLGFVGAMSALLVYWLRGDLEIPRERLVEHCAGLLIAASAVRSGG